MCILGLDTSNYTTSAALVRDGEILCDQRIQLQIPPGKKGLRQSDALFQHWKNLPYVLREPLKGYGDRIRAVCVSSTPRPVAGSYMPVFGAGVSSANILSDALRVPLYETSHQEGHFKAGAVGTTIDFGQPLIAAHLSGGTLEFILIRDSCYERVGGTKDISYGQLFDRTGVLLGLDFPAGQALDELALSGIDNEEKNPLGPVFRLGAWLNLSGTEQQVKQLIGRYETEKISVSLFRRIGESLVSVLDHLRADLNVDQVLITGGVAGSRSLRSYCRSKGYQFGEPSLCGDNAVGVALLKGQPIWQSNR